MNTQDYIALEEQYNAHNYQPLDVVLVRGEGIWVWDIEGNRYLDFLSAYSAINQGHAHPRILEAMVKQAAKLPLTSRAFRNDQLPLLAKELCELSGYEKILPMNSGVEAVETAIKAARKWGYTIKGVPANKGEIITCAGNFHGRTIAAISISTEPLYREGFGPYTPGFISIPFGDVNALKDAVTPNTVAFLVEPIQGEGGVIIPPEGYLQQAREICSQNNVLLITDEIQTGLGRTGKLFACDWEEIRPDVMVIGKALSGGFYPISAVLSSKEVLGVFNPGEHGSTFGGNPLASAIAREALRLLIDEGMIENARKQGSYLIEKLTKIRSKHVVEVRGRGLLIGVELKPSAGGARRFAEVLKMEGILCKETHENVLRFAPPLVITRQNLDWALERIGKVLMMS